MNAAPAIQPPNDLQRAEKREFRRVIAAKAAQGRPLVAIEVGALADYVRVRQRLVYLHMVAERRRQAGSTMASAGYLEALRAIETAMATSRRLARDLGLIPGAELHEKTGSPP